MINGISTSTNTYALKDLVNLAKYATGVPLTDEDKKLTISQVASYPAMMCTYEGLSWVKDNFGKYKQAFSIVTNHGKEAYNILKNSGVKGVLRTSDAKEILASIPKAEQLNKLSSATQDLYKNAQKFAEMAKSNPANKDAIKQAASFIAQADAKTYAEISKNSTGFFSKIGKTLGLTKLTQASKDLAAKSPLYKKCVDAYNNEAGSFMLAIQGGVELAVNVVPTFKKLGVKKGFKQLGRSIGGVFTSVAGWIAGSAVGTKIGQVIGAAVGNTKVGAVIGAVAGKVGSYALGTIGEHLASKATTKVLGKSELEKAKEEEAVKIAELAQQDPEVFDALIQQAAERLVVEGEDTAESKAVNQTLKNLVEQKDAAAKQTSPMMTREEMKAYADKLVSNPVKKQKSEYKGYIPSSDPAPIVAEQKPVEAPVQVETPKDEMTPEMKALLARADRVIKNGSRYLEK